eukprot:2194429-Prymnesium_polylepis.2
MLSSSPLPIANAFTYNVSHRVRHIAKGQSAGPAEPHQIFVDKACRARHGVLLLLDQPEAGEHEMIPCAGCHGRARGCTGARAATRRT